MDSLDIVFQLWGGIFYLIAKIFLSQAEGKDYKTPWRKYGWISYIVGVPAWAIILIGTQNWIALSVELGGVPSMILGLTKNPPNWMQKVAKIFIFILISIGTIYSIYQYKGINTFSQILELGVTAGFLIGTYLLAKLNPVGWLWFILMNTSMGMLMIMGQKYVFAFLQIISLCFVIYGFSKSKKLLINK